MNKIFIKDIINTLDKNKIAYNFHGNDKAFIYGICTYTDLKENKIGFYRGKKISDIPKPNQKNCTLIINKSIEDTYTKDLCNVFFVDDVDLVFCLIGNLLKKLPDPGIHPSAVVSIKANIDSTVTIGANVSIGNNVTIGKKTIIEAGSVINDAIIGSNVHIFPGVKIGSSGLGSHKDKDGRWHHFPHSGKVIIKNNVVIQDNAVIARGSLSDTILEDGVVIGPLTWIAHNTKINKNVLVGQSVKIAGSVQIDNGAIIWSGACIKDGTRIGKSSVIGMGSVVVRNVPDSTLFVGNPARLLREI